MPRTIVVPEIAVATVKPVAQLRYNPADHRWQLICSDRNSRWHDYDVVGPSPRIADLLDEVDADPTGIFWG